MKTLPLPTRDPLSGGPLLVTRLENPETGVSIEGRFEMGWVGKLNAEQLEFVGLLLTCRANVQRVAEHAGIAYNTARARLDEIVNALAPSSSGSSPDEKHKVLDALERGEVTAEGAIAALRRRPDRR